MVHLWMNVIILNPMMFYLSKMAMVVTEFKQLWFGRPKRKPPHVPKVNHLGHEVNGKCCMCPYVACNNW